MGSFFHALSDVVIQSVFTENTNFYSLLLDRRWTMRDEQFMTKCQRSRWFIAQSCISQ